MSETNGKAGQIFTLIPKVMASVGAIGKGRRNQQQGYAFRGIDDVFNAVQGPLAEAGVFIVPEVTDRHREERPTRDGKGVLLYTILTVRHTFYAPDGSSVAAVTTGEAMDSGDKSCNKAMSAAMKYALLEVFCIPTEDAKDTENDSYQTGRRREPARPAAAPAPVANKEGEELASAEQVREVKDLLSLVRLPDGTVDKWFAKAGVDRWDQMPANIVANCIRYVKGKKPAVAVPAS
jgi:hypothetical protein